MVWGLRDASTPLLRTEIGERADTDLLFPSRRGGYLPVGELRWVFDPAAKAIGVQGLTPHELRHTCASLAIAAGGNVKVLQTLLGHKTATLTLDRYGHLFPGDLGRIADAFDQAAGRRLPNNTTRQADWPGVRSIFRQRKGLDHYEDRDDHASLDGNRDRATKKNVRSASGISNVMCRRLAENSRRRAPAQRRGGAAHPRGR
jgi:hypothetical protein